MRWRHLGVAGLLVFGLALVGTAATDNASKIVGRWEVIKGEAPPGAVAEFTKDGKLKIRAKVDDKEVTVEGTYKVDGKKLAITIDSGGKGKTNIETIKVLSADRLVTESEKGKVTEFKRAKKPK
jgi:uncharacterized protein (TIGR03066 family)